MSVRAKTWRRELLKKPWKSAAYWLAHHVLLGLLSYGTQDHQPLGGSTHSGLDSPAQIIKKRLHGACPQPNLVEVFFISLGSLLQNGSYWHHINNALILYLIF